MSFPASPLLTFSNGNAPACDAVFLNNLQAGINQLCLGTTTHASLVIDGVGGNPVTGVGGRLVVKGGSTPTFTAGPAAGGSPTITITGNDSAGVIQVVTGSAPTNAGVVLTVNFSAAFGAAPVVVVTQTNGSNAYIRTQIGTVSTTSWQLVAADNLSNPAFTYIWEYVVIGK